MSNVEKYSSSPLGRGVRKGIFAPCKEKVQTQSIPEFELKKNSLVGAGVP